MGYGDKLLCPLPLRLAEKAGNAHEGPPFRLSKTPDRQFTSSCLGQHSEYVYKEILGYSDDEIAEMIIEGVITTEADVPDFKSSF